MNSVNKWTLLKSYNYRLPESLIAQHPISQRDHARLMVVNRASQKIIHERFDHIGEFLPKKSLIIINDSKVIPARLIGRKALTGGQVEVFILKQKSARIYEVLMRPMKRLKNGDKIIFPNARIYAQVIDKKNRLVEFNTDNLTSFLICHGKIPLPPYVKREDEKEDRIDYQTVYARHAGSVAAPTAGMHFSQKLMRCLETQGHSFSRVTLHINYATFKPVEEENITSHLMHKEFYKVSKSANQKIQHAKKSGREIVAVGTTSCRTLEAFAEKNVSEGETNLFIYPGCQFKYVDKLITNFHLPFSTLLMLVYAFGGPSLMKKAYKEAVDKKYRFYSYGDGMIIV